MLMLDESNLGSRVHQVKTSLDELHHSFHKDEYSDETLLRLGRALHDMNEELQLLRNIIQLGKP